MSQQELERVEEIDKSERRARGEIWLGVVFFGLGVGAFIYNMDLVIAHQTFALVSAQAQSSLIQNQGEASQLVSQIIEQTNKNSEVPVNLSAGAAGVSLTAGLYLLAHGHARLSGAISARLSRWDH